MPYPIEDDRERLLEMMQPQQRLLFEQLERQMKLTHTVMEAFLTVRWWAVICSIALAISILFDAATRIWRL